MILVQLYFVQSLDDIFNPFLTLFQREEPLVHILHDEMSQLVRTLLLRFLKPSVIEQKTGKGLLSVDIFKTENQLPLDRIEVGGPTRIIAFKKMKPERQKTAVLHMRSFYQTTAKYLLNNLPLGGGDGITV